MKVISRFVDARNTIEGKIISVLLSALLMSSFLNLSVFANSANATETEKDTNPKIALSAGEPETTPDINNDQENKSDDTNTPSKSDTEQNLNGTTDNTNLSDSSNKIPILNTTVPLTDRSDVSANTVANETEAQNNEGAAEATVTPRSPQLREIVIEKGQTAYVKCFQNHTHSFKTSDKSVARLRHPSNQAANEYTVTAKKEGTATITCGNETIYQITVVAPSSKNTTRVYLYVTIEGDASGWMANKPYQAGAENWYTIGYIEEKTLPPAHSASDGKNINPSDYTIVYHPDNAEIAKQCIDDISWGSLSKSSGAESYGVGSGQQWHIDGIYRSTRNLTINYVYEDQTEAAPTYQAKVKTGDAYSVESPEIKGYKADQAIVEGTIPSTNSSDVEVTVTYTAERYTITYDLNGGEKNPNTSKTTFESQKYGDKTPTILNPSKDGYVFDGWNPQYSATVTGDATYVAQWKKTHTITYKFIGSIPEQMEGQEPVDTTKYTSGREYTLKTVEPTTIETHDIYNNVNGKYVFQGWVDPNNGTMGDEDLTIQGEWKLEPVLVETHSVSYTWTGLPEGDVTFYNKIGEEQAVPTLPNSVEGLVNGQPYEIDATHPGVTIYTKDQYGNFNGSYIFLDWMLDDQPMFGEKSMGTENVEYSGIWLYSEVDVPTVSVSYEYTGDVPDNAPDLPESATYVPNQEVEVAEAPELNGWTFSGWDRDDFTVTEEDTKGSGIVITGSWIPVVDDLAVESYDGTYDAENHGVTVSGMMEGDAVSYTVDGEEITNEFIDVVDITVTVHVVRNGVEIWSKDATVQIAQAPVTITVDDATKVAGTDDPATFTTHVEGTIYNNELGEITASRTNADEAVGTYADVLMPNYLDNANYNVTVVPGTFTITAAPIPVVPDTPAPTPGPGTPLPVAGSTDAAATPAPAAPVAAVEIPDNANPLAQGTEEITDDETPLSTFDAPHCWTHILMIIGIIFTLIYGAFAIARRLFESRRISNMEKDVLGIDANSSRAHANSAAHGTI